MDLVQFFPYFVPFLLLLKWKHIPSRLKEVSSCRRRDIYRRCSIKMQFLKTSQNSQKNNCVGVFFKNVIPTQVLWIFLWILQNYLENLFRKHLRTTASVVGVAPKRNLIHYKTNQDNIKKEEKKKKKKKKKKKPVKKIQKM